MGGTRSIECLPRDAVSRVSPKHTLRRVVDRDMSVIELLFTVRGIYVVSQMLDMKAQTLMFAPLYFLSCSDPITSCVFSSSSL